MAWFTAPVTFSDGQVLTASQLNSTVTTIRDGTVTVTHGGTGLTAGTSGGVLYFSATTTLASSGALTANGVVLGGGAGAAPTATSAGSANEVLRVPSGGGAPAFGTVNLASSAAVTGTLAVANGGTGLTAAPTAGAVSRTAGDVTTTSTSLVDLTDATVTITTAARRVHYGASFTTFNSGASVNEFNVDVDGTLQFGSTGQRTATSLGGNHTPALTGLTGVLTAASHTIKIQWQVTGNTGTVEADATTTMHFYAFETGATA